MENILVRASCLMLLVILLPILLLISLLIIIIDNQFPIFVQERIGYQRRKINIYKFKTMSVNENKGKITPVEYNDARITKLGVFLRNNFIDEWPQIINIIIGDINLIGPRPLATSQDNEYLKNIKFWESRSSIKPGITGMSQSLNLPGGNSIEKRKIAHKVDLWYIRNNNFLLNIRIIIKTIKFIIKNI